MARSFFGILLISLITSCSDEGRHQPARTSAVTIGPEILAIGRDESRPGHLLHNIRGGVFKDSVVVLADGGSGELRILGMEGELIETMGRLGSGPGEFRVLWRMWAQSGDTLVTVDVARRVFGLWSVQSGFIEEAAMPAQFAVEGADATTIVGVYPPEDVIEMSGTQRADSATIVILDRHAPDVAHELMSIPWRHFLSIEAPHGRTLGMAHPLQPKGFVTTKSNMVYYAFAEAAVVRRFDSRREGRESLSLDIPRRSLTADLRNTWIDSEVARVPSEQKAAMRRYVESVPLPDSLPMIDALIVDEVGRIWTRDFAIAGETHATWRVADRTGQSIGAIKLPYAARPLHIAEDAILVHIRPDDEAEEVLLYELNSSTAASLMSERVN